MTHAFIAELKALGLADGDWALFGSGPLLLRGWVEEVNDLDVISRGRAWAEAQKVGNPRLLADGNTIMTIGENITIGTSWAYGEVDIDRLIDTAELIGGIPCVRLEHIIAYKRIADRPRDREHLGIIEAHT